MKCYSRLLLSLAALPAVVGDGAADGAAAANTYGQQSKHKMTPSSPGPATPRQGLRRAENDQELDLLNDEGQQRRQQRRVLEEEEEDSDVIGYIIGGTEVTDAERYKYMVSLTKWGSHFCGGALIAPDLVISAAHCQNIDGAKLGILNKNDGNGVTFTGIQNVTSSPTCDNTAINLKKIHIHTNYGENYVNDVMIVKLPGLVDTSVYPMIEINNNENIPSVGDPVTTLGWGQTIAGSSTSMAQRLQEVEVNVISDGACMNMYGGYFQSNMLCAMDAGQDACQGDSGGPLIKRGTGPSTDTLVGVVSWGYGCASASHAGVYSRLSYNYEWIKDKVCCLSSNPPASFNCPTTSSTPVPPTPAPSTPAPPTPAPAPPTPAPTPTPAPPTPATTEETTPVPPTPPTPPPPTPAPPTYPAPEPRTNLTICVQLDLYPKDLAMWLESASGAVVYFYADNLDDDPYGLFEHTVTFEDAELLNTTELRFMMTDSYGDGLTMTSGTNSEGYYYLRWNSTCDSIDNNATNNVARSGNGHNAVEGAGSFGFVVDETFPVNTTCSDINCIEIEFQMDSFPHDITYSVTCGNETLRDHQGNFNNGKDSDRQITRLVHIPDTITDDCEVTIHDKHGDGLCCAYGNGYVNVYLGGSQGTFLGGTGNETSTAAFANWTVQVGRTTS